ncbi:MAG: hypothetical protein K0R15_968 [Clostridiales bacterium]|jgi:histidine triad (HIT) family protein|nr:hypothetical protein [Clostridiales bacterium]
MDKNNCIFCKITSGEIKSITIFENTEFKVIMDLFPATKGHTLIITKEHFDNIYEIDSDTAGRLFALATHISRALKAELNCDGLNVLQNNGVVANQSIPHFHLHLIPRYLNDGLNMTFDTKEAAIQEELTELATKIRLHI